MQDGPCFCLSIYAFPFVVVFSPLSSYFFHYTGKQKAIGISTFQLLTPHSQFFIHYHFFFGQNSVENQSCIPKFIFRQDYLYELIRNKQDFAAFVYHFIPRS